MAKIREIDFAGKIPGGEGIVFVGFQERADLDLPLFGVVVYNLLGENQFSIRFNGTSFLDLEDLYDEARTEVFKIAAQEITTFLADVQKKEVN